MADIKNKFTIFLDMDGVLCNFEKAKDELPKRIQRYILSFWKKWNGLGIYIKHIFHIKSNALCKINPTKST
jgi:hypothetical protein